MPAGFVEPAYGRNTLGDVLPAVSLALGVDLAWPVSSLVFPEAPSYVVLLVDGLGSEQLERYAHAAPYLSSLEAQPATAGVPSTTATSLTSFGTGLPPGAHGLVGFATRLPGTDRLLDHLQWSPDVDAVDYQPHPTVLGRMAAAGIRVTTINRRQFEGSGLTVAASRGADFVGADHDGERIAAAMSAAGRSPSLTYLYHGDLDWTGHRYGVASTAWLQELAMVDAVTEQLREALPRETRLVVLADHGMVDSPKRARVDVDDWVELRDGVALMGGEARFRHLYCSAGAVDDVTATWRAVLGDRATVLTREEAIARGWFGPVEGRVWPRIGDVVVACHGDTAVISRQRFGYEAGLIGLHGSLTSAEMLIPMLSG